jgi:hypothetical protein
MKKVKIYFVKFNSFFFWSFKERSLPSISAISRVKADITALAAIEKNE